MAESKNSAVRAVDGLGEVDFLFFKIENFNAHIVQYFTPAVYIHSVLMAIVCFILAVLPIVYLLGKNRADDRRFEKILFQFMLIPAFILLCFSTVHLYFCVLVLYGDTPYMDWRMASYFGLAIIFCLNAYVFLGRDKGKMFPKWLYAFMSSAVIIIGWVLYALSQNIIML